MPFQNEHACRLRRPGDFDPGSFRRITNNNNTEYTIRTETVNGQEYMVVPVVMMCEGVHSGSHGPIYHTADQLGAYVESWNGIPVTIRHPKQNNQYVSANSPSIREQFAVGTVYNAHMDGDKLKADAYILHADIQRVSAPTLQMIENNVQLDVSVGVFSDQIEERGTWNGATYNSIATNYRPDHLALLPDEEGACNWEAGCGIRTNSKNENMNTTEFKSLYREYVPPALSSALQVNVLDYKARVRNVQRALDGMDQHRENGVGVQKVHFLEELYENYFIMRVTGDPETAGYFKQNYHVAADDTIIFDGEPTKVVRTVSYAPVQQTNSKTSTYKRTKPVTNNKNENTMNVEQKVNELITLSDSFCDCDDDRAFLMNKTEEQLDQLITNAKDKKEQQKEPEVQVNNTSTGNLVDYNQLMQQLPPEMRQSLAYGQQLLNNRKNELIAKIQTNAKDVWSQQDLQAMDFSMLEKVAASIPTPQEQGAPNLQSNAFPNAGMMYTFANAQGAPQTNNDPSGGVLMPNGVQVNKKGDDKE